MVLQERLAIFCLAFYPLKYDVPKPDLRHITRTANHESMKDAACQSYSNEVSSALNASPALPSRKSQLTPHDTGLPSAKKRCTLNTPYTFTVTFVISRFCSDPYVAATTAPFVHVAISS
jgi:hypothetical protein